MKKIKKTLAIVATCVMVISTAITAFAAEHQNPNTGGLCNNTYYTQSHYMQTGWRAGETHKTTDGLTCYVDYATYMHKRLCSSCGYNLGYPNSECQIIHSRCGRSQSTCGL